MSARSFSAEQEINVERINETGSGIRGKHV